jgi:hypothetical protein
MVIPCIDRLGAELEDSWRAREYDPSAFPGLAERLLREADLPIRIPLDDLTTWVLEAPSLPPQADRLSKFGQPPLTLYRGSRFYIDALFWVDGTTSIHQHAFSGAFQVLAGSSIETLFGFKTERAFDGHFLLGKLETRSCGLLTQGDVKPIWSGPALIHSVFHLERPSLSLVVRTGNDPGVGPQFNYSRSGIARNPFFVDETVERKLQIVSMLRTTQHPSLEKIVGDLISHSDLHTAYRVLRDCANLGVIDRLVERVRDKEVADRFYLAIKDHRREAFLTNRRSVVVDAELRFFLGVLLNAPRRRDVLAVTHQRKPDIDPAGQVAAWLRQLSNVTVKLQVEGVPWQPNLLGLPEFDDDLERACSNVLGGQAVPLDGKTAKDLAQLRSLPALSCLFDS